MEIAVLSLSTALIISIIAIATLIAIKNVHKKVACAFMDSIDPNNVELFCKKLSPKEAIVVREFCIYLIEKVKLRI